MSAEQFIDGMHNYCDRWCERCSDSPRCRVYHQTERDRRRHEQRGEDPDSAAATVQDVGRSLAKVHRLLERFARREGVNLDELAKAAPAEGAGRRLESSDQPLVRHAEAFMTGCRELLDRLRAAFDESADDVNRRGGFMDVTAESELLRRVRESYEILCWDHTVIAVKLNRALSSRRRAAETDDPQMRSIDLFDAAGSAAVARRSLLRSQAALQTVYDWDESLQDGIIELLATAERLVRGVEAQIPACATFQWPPVLPPDDPQQ